jgi:endo-1,4-beta-D-glucanase Y
MKRRMLLKSLAAFAGMSTAGGALARSDAQSVEDLRPIWEAWKDAFLRADGRVVDTLQQEASHSEGQGYGMVLASFFEDESAFERMFEWTERNLAIRSDALLAWRWLPAEANPVPDRNNASDGDLFYAWALARAGAKFGQRSYLRRAQDIVDALAETCIMPMPGAEGRLLFLPAEHGFTHDDRITINPSYYMPLAMRELAAATGVSKLAACAQAGEALLDELAADGLVPDWVDISEDGMRPAADLPSNAGYEAMRVPLFLIWSRLHTHRAVRQIARVYERQVEPGRSAPTVIEPLSGLVLETSADPGYQALAGLSVCANRNDHGAALPPFTASQPYYPATLQLFAMIAVLEASPECVPL